MVSWSETMCATIPLSTLLQRPIPHVSLFEQLLAEKVLEWSCIRSEIWQGERCGVGGGVHSTRKGMRGERLAGWGIEDAWGIRERESRGHLS